MVLTNWLGALKTPVSNCFYFKDRIWFSFNAFTVHLYTLTHHYTRATVDLMPMVVSIPLVNPILMVNKIHISAIPIGSIALAFDAGL